VGCLLYTRYKLSIRNQTEMLSNVRLTSSHVQYLPIFVKPSQFLLSDVISKRTTFSQPFPPPSHPAANAPLFFLRYRRYINHLRTYLLTLNKR